jgi:hypothetical protein
MQMHGSPLPPPAFCLEIVAMSGWSLSSGFALSAKARIRSAASVTRSCFRQAGTNKSVAIAASQQKFSSTSQSRFPFDSFAALSPSGQALTRASRAFGMTIFDH